MDKPYLQITLNDIIEDAKEHKRVKFLKSLHYTITNEETGKTTEPSFLEVKRSYCLEFYPEIVPHKQEKETMWERIMSL